MQSQLYLNDIIPILRKAGILLHAHARELPAKTAFTSGNPNALKPGEVFIAYKGVQFDSHTLIPKAIHAGTDFVILEDESFMERCKNIPCALVKCSREAWSYLAAAQWGNPHEDLKITGVTGTNGKTSTVWLYKELLKAVEVPSLAIGTLGAYFPKIHQQTTHTTPDPNELFQLLHDAKKQHIKHVAMEVSSHSLIQKKIGPIQYDLAGFTSFSQDHLDFHTTMEEYLDAKCRLFSDHMKKENSIAVIHGDVMPLIAGRSLPKTVCIYGDENELGHNRFEENIQKHIIQFKKINYEGSLIEISSNGDTCEGLVPFFGDYAVKNFVGALILAENTLQKKIDPTLWKKVLPVPGRLEPIREKDGSPFVFVDYAHTPDALEKTLRVLRPFCSSRLLVVFGCGGDRDKTKRPLMAKKAETFADEIIITSDNPRTEDPHVIIENIMVGFTGMKKTFCIEQREEAIAFAIKNAKKNDIVLIAGKGHEDYQIIGKTKYHFDDREIARKYLQKK